MTDEYPQWWGTTPADCECDHPLMEHQTGEGAFTGWCAVIECDCEQPRENVPGDHDHLAYGAVERLPGWTESVVVCQRCGLGLVPRGVRPP